MNLAARHDRQLGAILLCVLVFFAFSVAAYSWRSNGRMADAYGAVTRAYAITLELDAVLGLVADSETAERGFLIAGGGEDIPRAYVNFIRGIDSHYAMLTALTADDAAQGRRVALLGPLLANRKTDLQSIAAVRRSGGIDAARAVIADDLRKPAHEQIRAGIGLLHDGELAAIVRLNEDAATVARRARIGMNWLIAVALAVLGGGIVLLEWLGMQTATAANRKILASEKEKERLQATLVGNFELLARVGELAKIGGWEIDPATRRLMWSPEVYKIHETEDMDAPPIERALDFYGPAARARLEAAFDLVCKSGGSFDLELQLVTAKGRHVWVRTMGTAILENGVVIKIQGALQDISDRKQVELALESSTRLLHSIVDHMPAMVLVKRADNLHIVALNPAGEQLLGYSQAEVFDKSDYELFSATEALRFAAADRQLLDSGGPLEIPEEPITTAAGEIRYLHTKKVVLRNDAGDAEHLLVISLDITARKQADESKKLLNELLVSARDRSETANQAKSQFLANMSHEIRTPMSAVIGMLQLLAQTDLVRRQQDYVAKAQSAARSLLAILNDILDFSKIEAGKMSLDLRSFRLKELTGYLVTILTSSIGGKNIEGLLDVDRRLPLEIQGDSMRLQQVLINLTSNAVKFTERGEIVISLKLLRMDESTVEIEFAVRDTGLGIETRYLQDIFEGFSQGESSTARRFGGTGLGLAISKRLVEMMGGVLRVESVAGMGSRFYFSVSFARVAAAGLPQNKYPATPIPGLAANHRLRVLIVDDNTSAREVLCGMVELLGWECRAVASGAAALEALRREPAELPAFDVVFMDWSMPQMDGWQTTQQIRKVRDIGDAPVIIMVSAHSREALVDRLREEPGVLNGFLIKPITASGLFNAVVDAKAGEFRRSEIASRPPSTRLSGLRLLVVEDNLLNQQVACELLSNEGAIVSCASDGRHGVEAALGAEPLFDVVLMDIQMPDIDGYAATAELRRQGLRSMPIIAMTANAMAEDKAACVAAGMNDHITKPIDLDVMVNTILRHCPVAGVVSAAVSRPGALDARAVESWSDAGTRREFDHALHRVGDNRALFCKMADIFVHSTGKLAGQLRHSLATEDVDSAKRLLHTLIGTAGTVGAKQLAECAARMDRQLRDAATADLVAAAGEFDALVLQSCDALQAYAAPFVRDAAALSALAARTRFDAASFGKSLDSLDALMREQDMQAMQAFEELRTLFGGVLGYRLLDLERAMNDLDFPLALRRTQSLRQSLK
jgi:PAS domain S-box-containing protein